MSSRIPTSAKYASASKSQIAAVAAAQKQKVPASIEAAITSIFWVPKPAYDPNQYRFITFTSGAGKSKVFAVTVETKRGTVVTYAGQKLVGRLIANGNILGRTDVLDQIAPYLINYRTRPRSTEEVDDFQLLVEQMYFSDPEKRLLFEFDFDYNNGYFDKLTKLTVTDVDMVGLVTSTPELGINLVRKLYSNAVVQGREDLFLNEVLPYIDV